MCFMLNCVANGNNVVIGLFLLIILLLCAGLESSWPGTQPGRHYRQLTNVLYVSSSECCKFSSALFSSY